MGCWNSKYQLLDELLLIYLSSKLPSVYAECHWLLSRAVSAGCKSPLLVCPQHDRFPQSARVTALGALHAAYVVSQLVFHSLGFVHDVDDIHLCAYL